MKILISQSEQKGHRSAIGVGHRQVRETIAVEVPNRQRHRSARHGLVHAGLKGPIAISLQSDKVAISADRQVQDTVTVEIRGNHRSPYVWVISRRTERA